MTHLEKFFRDNPKTTFTAKYIQTVFCPPDAFGVCPKEYPKSTPISVACPACWNMEIPEEADA